MTRVATADFWDRFRRLPAGVQKLARKNHRLLIRDPKHPALRFKKLAGVSPPLRSIRVGRNYRALGQERGGTVYWFWIGPHAEYVRLVT